MTFDLALVIPCYNEAKRFDWLTFSNFTKDHSNIMLMFVNDGSTDETHSILEKFKSAHKNSVHHLSLDENKGKAEAVREGLNYALQNCHTPLVGYWDADLSTPLSEVSRFIEVFEANKTIDAVFGSRVKLLGRSIERRFVRHYLGRIFATFASTVLKLPIYDTQCGAKILRASEELQSCIQKPFITKWIFDVELIARLKLAKGRTPCSSYIYELPLNRWVEVGGSKVKPSDFFIAIYQIAKIFRKYRN